MSCDLPEKRNTLLKLAHYFRLPLQALHFVTLDDFGRLGKWCVLMQCGFQWLSRMSHLFTFIFSYLFHSYS